MNELSNLEQENLFKKERLSKDDFSKLYLTHHKKVLDFIHRRVSNQQVAEDLTSEIFEKVLKTIADFQWQGITVSAWIFRIARNHLIDYYRKNDKHKNDQSLDELANIIVAATPTTDVEIEKDDAEVALYNAMRELSEEDQYLVYYKFFEEMSNKQISDVTKMTETNIGTRLHRIRKKLGHLIKKIEKENPDAYRK